MLNSRWISLAVAALCVYALFIIGGDDRFYLNYIPVEGSSTIDINSIVAESGLAGRHIFAADPQEAADRISEIGGVVTATVTLHWPNDVMIRIREKPPLATWQEGDKTFWIDEDGQLTTSRAQTVGLLNIISEAPPDSAAPDAIREKVDKIIGTEEAGEPVTDESETTTDEETVASRAAFVPRDVLAGALQLRELRPNIDKLYYKPSDGLGYQDGRGWTPISGRDGTCTKSWSSTRRSWQICWNAALDRHTSAWPTSTSRTTGWFRRTGNRIWKTSFLGLTSARPKFVRWWAQYAIGKCVSLAWACSRRPACARG